MCMVAPIQAAPPVESLGLCAVVIRGEFCELIRRIEQFVADIFFAIAEFCINTTNFLFCSEEIDVISERKERPFTPPIPLETLSCVSEGLEKLKIYQALPGTSPAFEQAAVQMAAMWLSAQEIQGIKDYQAEGIIHYAKIIVRASIFNHANIISASMDQAIFHVQCGSLWWDFQKLPLQDKKIILDHFDSEIKDNSTCLEPKKSEIGEEIRPFVPVVQTLSAAGLQWWTDQNRLVQTVYADVNHPIIQKMAQAFPSTA